MLQDDRDSELAGDSSTTCRKRWERADKTYDAHCSSSTSSTLRWQTELARDAG